MVSDDDVLEEISFDYKSANIDKKDLYMLEYAEKVTDNLSSVSEEDIEKLKSVGFCDEAIFDINQVTSYFNYVNRIADGLGVELE